MAESPKVKLSSKTVSPSNQTNRSPAKETKSGRTALQSVRDKLTSDRSNEKN